MYIIFLLFCIVLTTSNTNSHERGLVNKFKMQHRVQSPGEVSHDESHSVCLFCHTRLNMKTWTITWEKKLFSYMKRLLLESILRQCNDFSPCPSMKTFYWVIFVDSVNEKFNNFIEEAVNLNLINITVFRADRPRIKRRCKEMMRNVLQESHCEWLSYLHIDADDAFSDGYFNYVTSEIPKKLLRTRTVNGLPWRGAVFAPRSMSAILMGRNRCSVEHLRLVFTSGFSQGQGYIMKMDVQKSVGTFIRRPAHWLYLRYFREFVMKNLGFEQYRSQCCEGANHFWKNTKKQIDLEIKDATTTQIMFIDLSVESSPMGIFVRTPYSSHFPWKEWRNIPVCNNEQKLVVQREYPKDIQYILQIASTLNLSIDEACINNWFFANQHSDQCERIRNRN